MTKITVEDIIFWIAITSIIGILIWKLIGSPTDMATLISISSLLLMSELVLWKKIFSIKNKTSIGFIKVRSEINLLKNDMNHHLNNINNRLDNIESLIKRKK